MVVDTCYGIDTVTLLGDTLPITIVEDSIIIEVDPKPSPTFEAPVDMKLDNLKSTSQNKKESSYHGVSIRAPAVCSCDSDKVEVLGTVKSPREESSTVVVAVKQGNVIATAFHPELTDDPRFHQYFLDIVANNS